MQRASGGELCHRTHVKPASGCPLGVVGFAHGGVRYGGVEWVPRRGWHLAGMSREEM